jgi:hypothetical protein
MELIWSTCPVVLQRRVEFGRLVDASGTGTTRFLRFSAEVMWLRSTEAKVVFEHGGREIKTGGTFTDHFGLYTSFDGDGDAIARARQAARDYAVTASSTLEIKVLVKLTDDPFLQPPQTDNVEARSLRRQREYARLPRDWVVFDEPKMSACYEARDREAYARAYAELERLGPRLRQEDVCVWTTRNTPLQNTAQRRDAISLFDSLPAEQRAIGAVST